jgi:hypothetical protein
MENLFNRSEHSTAGRHFARVQVAFAHVTPPVVAGEIWPHAADQCVRRQSGSSALADVLFRDHRRRRHSRRNGVRESDKTGAYVKDKPLRPQDLGATIYHALGVPLGLRLGNDGFTRPISSGEPILDLFG